MKKLYLIGGVAAAITAYVWWRSNSGNDGQDEDMIDAAQTTIDEAAGVLTTSPVQEMATSQQMLDQLKSKESCRLTAYQLEDGKGMTIGYGHKFQPGETVYQNITQEQAEAYFADDVANRAEKWVKLYVTVDLSQNQFDALVSIAFNMSPQSFKKFANEVNAGNGIDGIAKQSVSWVAEQYQNGIQNRRNNEMLLFNQGVYA
ncbi:lysozyme [Undibacterium sp. SXout11W]|uniref:lysozyme n=1 Tax=Undibacterium sp. SXout11W TaxID=3413050 RepID=UPI003BF0134B